jgi:WD40 repeat protein
MLVLLVLIVFGSIRFGYINQQQAEQLRHENVRALAAESEALGANRLAKEHFYELSMGRAEAGRFSGRLGQNFATMESISTAVALLPQLDLSKEDRQAEKLKLRNLAIAAMSLVDLREQRAWDVGSSEAVTLDSNHEFLGQGDGQGNITIRHVDGNLPVVTLASPGHKAHWMKFSNDRSFLVSKHNWTDAYLTIWNLREGTKAFQVKEDLGQSSAEMSPNNHEVAIGRKRGAVDVLSLADGSVTFSLPTGFDPVDIVFDATGRRLACAAGRKIQIWSLGNESPDTELELVASVSQLAWNSEHSILVAGTALGHLVAWHDAEFRLPPWNLEPHNRDRVVRLAIHPNGELLVSRGWDDIIRVNDLTTQQQVLRINGGRVLNCGFNQDGSGIAVMRDQRVGIWRLPERPLTVLRSNSNDRLGATRFHPHDRRLLMSPGKAEIEFWSVQQRKVIGTINSGNARCQFTPNGSAVLTAGTSGIRRWPIELSETPENELRVTVGEPKLVYQGRSERFCIDASGRFIAIDTGAREIIVVDLEDEAAIQRMPHYALDRVAMTPDASAVISSTWQGADIRVWDRATGDLITKLASGWGSASIAISKRGDRLMAGTGPKFAMWDTTTWKSIWQHDRNSPDNWPGPVAFSKDDRYLACGFTRYVPQLCDANTGDSIAILEAPKTQGADAFTFSHDDELLAINSLNNIHLWNLKTLRDRLSALGLSWDE